MSAQTGWYPPITILALVMLLASVAVYLTCQRSGSSTASPDTNSAAPTISAWDESSRPTPPSESHSVRPGDAGGREISGRRDLTSRAVTVDGHKGRELRGEIEVHRDDGILGDQLMILVLDIGDPEHLAFFLSEARNSLTVE